MPCHHPIILLGLAAALVAAEPHPTRPPDRELPVPGSVVLSGSLRIDDLASFPMAPSAPMLKSGPRFVEVAAAVGAMPVVNQGGLAKAVPDWLHGLATGWALEPPVEGKDLGLLVVGPQLSPDHRQCRIEAIHRYPAGVKLDLAVWSEPMPKRDATPAPVRQVWLLRLPPMPAGPCEVSVMVRWDERDPSTGLIHSEDWAAGPLVSCTVAATATAAAGGRASVSLPLSHGRACLALGGGEWLPQAVIWGHAFQPPAALAGTGVLGVRGLDVQAIAATLANHDKVPSPEAILASGTEQRPTLVVNGPMLNTGEHATLRSATWTAGDRLEVVMAVWHDGMPRAANIPHQETFLLPLHRPQPAQDRPIRVQLAWESRFQDEKSRWYDREPGRPRNVPADAVMAWGAGGTPAPAVRTNRGMERGGPSPAPGSPQGNDF